MSQKAALSCVITLPIDLIASQTNDNSVFCLHWLVLLEHGFGLSFFSPGKKFQFHA